MFAVKQQSINLNTLGFTVGSIHTLDVFHAGECAVVVSVVVSVVVDVAVAVGVCTALAVFFWLIFFVCRKTLLQFKLQDYNFNLYRYVSPTWWHSRSPLPHPVTPTHIFQQICVLEVCVVSMKFPVKIDPQATNAVNIGASTL